ncbi:MAG: dTMP kinase [Verrucomicrobia bacterium]|nr:dTMP kinase [Verrucomicrobiota bacterium]
MPHGRFISFEGGEACGKSTQIRLLAARLEAMGRTVLVVREPGGTPLGERIRDLLKHDPAGRGMAPETELLLMNASRAELVRRVIRPALESGTCVLSDRFADSTVAYQGAGRGLDRKVVAGVIEAATDGIRPGRTLWLRVPSAVAADRLRARNAAAVEVTDRFEQEQRSFFDRVEQAYEAIGREEPDRFLPVDGTGAPEIVSDRIWKLVEPWVGAAD